MNISPKEREVLEYLAKQTNNMGDVPDRLRFCARQMGDKGWLLNLGTMHGACFSMTQTSWDLLAEARDEHAPPPTETAGEKSNGDRATTEPVGSQPDGPKWSEPKSPTEWQKELGGISQSTWLRDIKKGNLVVDRSLGPKRVRISIDSLEKYRASR